MYAEHLRTQDISIDNLFLDPNNPRFWATEAVPRILPDKKIPNENIQAQALENIKEYDIEELITSMLRNGFLPLDRIVVRELSQHEKEYVAVEGNRRLAALKILRRRIENQLIDFEAENLTEGYLDRLKADTDLIEVLVYTGEEKAEISWMLQGIRHVSGIYDWKPAQRGKLVADQIEKHNGRLGFREAGQHFGLSAKKVGKYYRTYKALRQMQEDEEFRDKAKNEYFTLFEEAIRNKTLKDWMGWIDKEEYRFSNIDNLHQFYSWISPDEDHADRSRRIHDPKHISKFGTLISGKHYNLIDLIDNHEITIEAAYERAMQIGQRHKWKEALDRALELLGDIPQSAIAEAPKLIIGKLEKLEKAVANIKRMAAAVIGE